MTLVFLLRFLGDLHSNAVQSDFRAATEQDQRVRSD